MYSPWLQVLPNGIRSFFWESPFTKIATVQCFFPGGRRLETPEKAGISKLITHCLFYEQQDVLEELGSAVTVEAEADYFLISAKCLEEDLPGLLQFLAVTLPQVQFSASTLAAVKAETIVSLQQQNYNPFACAYRQLQPLLYDHHPYSLSSEGTMETISALQTPDLQDHYDRFYLPSAMILAITANRDPKQISELVMATFSTWHNKREMDYPHLPAGFIPYRQQQNSDREQAWVLVGFPAPASHEEDFFAMKIINAHLGNGSSSRLFQVLREQTGLVYDVATHYPTRYDRSHLLIHCTTAVDYVPKVQELIWQECQKLQTELLPAADLELAKSKLLGHYALAKQTPSQLAHIHSWYHALQLPPDFDFQFIKQIEITTPQQVQEVAQKYLTHCAISVV
ncbi:MAG: M16 family metallopeptidase [Pseudanabaenaceae cyanobacterium]